MCTGLPAGNSRHWHRELVRKPLVEHRETLRLQKKRVVIGGNFRKKTLSQRRQLRQTSENTSAGVMLRIAGRRRDITERDSLVSYLMDSNETFWELPLLRRAEVHPHPSLGVPLQRISPPLACGSSLSRAHSAHAPSLQLRLRNPILINHTTKGRRCGGGPCPRFAAVSCRLLQNRPISDIPYAIVIFTSRAPSELAFSGEQPTVFEGENAISSVMRTGLRFVQLGGVYSTQRG